MKIQTSEAVARFNAQIELADYALGLAAVDIADVRKLASLLSIAGHHGLRATLLEAAAELGYCAPDGGPAREPGQSPDKPAASNPTKSAKCVHNNMRLIDKDKPLGRFVWECADCGYVYGKVDADNWRAFIENSAHPGDVANVILERDRLRSALQLCVARLAEYPDAEGGTALEIGRRALKP